MHFNQNPTEESYVIRGVKAATQNSDETKLRVVEGGFGKNHVTVAVTLPENVDISEISFYGDVIVSIKEIRI